jgi:hypothetical protein
MFLAIQINSRKQKSVMTVMSVMTAMTARSAKEAKNRLSSTDFTHVPRGAGPSRTGSFRVRSY